MRSFYSYLLLVFALLFSSCKKENMGDCFKSTGEISMEIRELHSFHLIDLNGNVDLYLQQDTFNQIRVVAGENLIPLIKTQVNNGVLEIDNNNTCNWVRSFKNEVRVYVTAQLFSTITCNGTGSVNGTGTIVADTLGIDLWAPTDVKDLEVNTGFFYAKNHVSVGDVYVSGTSDEAYFYSTGNGFMHASGLEADLTTAIHNGTGEFHVRANQKLFAEIHSLGNIYYSGNPPEIESEITGSGELIPE